VDAGMKIGHVDGARRRSDSTLGMSRRVVDLSARRLLPAVAAGVASAACGIGLLGTSGWLITRAALHPPVFVLSIAIGMVQAFALGRGVFRYLQRLAVHDLSLEVLGKLRVHLFDILEPLVPGGLRSHGSGEVVSGFVADTELVAEGLSKTVTAAVDVSASIALGALVACLVEPTLGAVIVVGALGVVLVAFAFARVGRAGTGQEARARSELAGSVIETMRAAPELVAYGREDLVRQRLEAVRRRSTSAAVDRALGIGLGRMAVTWVAGATLVAVVAVGIGAVDSHKVSGVMLAVIAFVALAVFDQCAALPVVLADADAGDEAAHHLGRLGALEPPTREASSDHGPHLRSAGAALVDVDLVIDGTSILRSVSLQVEPGRRVALVGPNGSGKTRAVHTLLHFVECSRGRASIGGIDVRSMTRPGIARHVGWMTGETHVFAAQLGENLRLGQPAASDEECLSVLERVGLESWYRTLPDGLSTMLGAGGRPMSAGERQRLGLARAILAGGSILLLDESTAHLDPSSAARVLSELLGAAGVRSVLVVSHEPDIGRFVDEVVTLESGRVVGRAAMRPGGL